MNKTALILGYTGLVGGHCLRQLLDSPFYSQVVAIGRRSSGLSHPKLVERIIDFERLYNFASAFSGDDLFYCMGSTIKKAGSQKAFRKIDFEYPLEIAKLAYAQGVKKWLMVSSVGASEHSSSFYLRTKGEIEVAVSKVGFKEIYFCRPSFLLGDREEHRPLEKVFIPLFKAFTPLMVGGLRQYRPVEAADVARQMISHALK